MATATYNEAGATYEDTDFLYDGMPEARGVSVLLGSLSAAEDVSPLVKWETLIATDSGSSAIGTISFRLEERIADLSTLTDQALVRVIDHDLHADVIRGLVTARKPIELPGYSATEVIAEDIGALLDDAFIASEQRAAETAQVRVKALWDSYASSPLDLDDVSFIADIGSTLAAQDFVGVSLRQAIESTISQASSSADYYVDSLGRLHVFTSESNDAPANINADSPGAGEIAPERLEVEYDSKSYANRVYIQGGTPAGSGYFEDTVAIAAVGGMTRTRVLRAPDCTTSSMAQALANMYLGRQAGSRARGSFITGSPNDGWRAGQNLTVTSADHGLSAEAYRIAAVTTRVRRPSPSALVRQYTVEFGGSRAGGASQIADTLGSGQLVHGNLGGESNTYVSADGVAVTDGSDEKVRVGHIDGLDGVPSGVEYGLWIGDGAVVVYNGTTVIIDGTSNMFKIAASGTISHSVGPDAGGDGQVADTSVTLTALGTFSSPRAHLSLGALTTTGTDSRVIGGLSTLAYMPEHDAYAQATTFTVTTALNGSSQLVVFVRGFTGNQSNAESGVFQYHVLEEAAI